MAERWLVRICRGMARRSHGPVYSWGEAWRREVAFSLQTVPNPFDILGPFKLVRIHGSIRIAVVVRLERACRWRLRGHQAIWQMEVGIFLRGVAAGCQGRRLASSGARWH